MARRATGTVVEHNGADGTIHRALRFSAYGQRRYGALGPVSRGRGSPAPRHGRRRRARDLAARRARAAPVTPEPTFHAFAEQWWIERERELRPRAQRNYRWRLEWHLIPFFQGHRLTQITIAEVDRYKAAKLREGRLSPRSINMTLTLLGAILEVAEERELIARNPAKGKRRRVRESRPQRSYLDTAQQITALLDAAGAMDAKARRDRRATSRRALLAVLVFAGRRIGELVDLRWRDVDLAAGRLRIGDAKTDAGRRDVTMRPALRD